MIKKINKEEIYISAKDNYGKLIGAMYIIISDSQAEINKFFIRTENRNAGLGKAYDVGIRRICI